MARMQQAIQRYDGLFAEHFNNIPQRLPDTIDEIERSLKSIRSEAEKERLRAFQSRYQTLSTEIGELASEFAAHKEVGDANIKNNSFNSAIPMLHDRLVADNAALLESCERDLKERLAADRSPPPPEPRSKTPPFHNPLAGSPYVEPLPEVPDVESASTIVERIQIHNAVIVELESKLQIAEDRQAVLEAIQKDQIQKILDMTDDNRRRLKEFDVRANFIATKVSFPPRQKRRPPKPMPPKSEEPIPTEELTEFTYEVEDEYKAALVGVQIYRDRAGAKLRLIDDQIGEVARQIEEFETKVEAMNDSIRVMEGRTANLDANMEQWENEDAEGVTEEQLVALIGEYRSQAADVQHAVRQEVAALKARLFALENSPAAVNHG
jgi:predicted  nucleic acid-binding Zn-ribbon protein